MPPAFYNPSNRDPAEAFEKLEQIIRMKIKADKNEMIGLDKNGSQGTDSDEISIEVQTLEWVLSQMQRLR